MNKDDDDIFDATDEDDIFAVEEDADAICEVEDDANVEKGADSKDESAGLLQNAMSLYKECSELEAKTEQIRLMTQVQLANIAARYQSCHEFLAYTFGERDKALEKHYDLLDQAMSNGDKDLVVEALRGISGIVTKSPLEDFEKFAKIFEDTSKPLLDF